MAATFDRARWAIRFGIFAGGAFGLIAAFATALLVEQIGGNPEWVLRLGSAAGMVVGGLSGRRLGTWHSGRLYAPLGIAAGLLVSACLATLIAATLR